MESEEFQLFLVQFPTSKVVLSLKSMSSPLSPRTLVTVCCCFNMSPSYIPSTSHFFFHLTDSCSNFNWGLLQQHIHISVATESLLILLHISHILWPMVCEYVALERSREIWCSALCPDKGLLSLVVLQVSNLRRINCCHGRSWNLVLKLSSKV